MPSSPTRPSPYCPFARWFNTRLSDPKRKNRLPADYIAFLTEYTCQGCSQSFRQCITGSPTYEVDSPVSSISSSALKDDMGVYRLLVSFKIVRCTLRDCSLSPRHVHYALVDRWPQWASTALQTKWQTVLSIFSCFIWGETSSVSLPFGISIYWFISSLLLSFVLSAVYKVKQFLDLLITYTGA